MSIEIIKSGLLDTIQDPGRTGYRYLGINPGGVMDTLSAAIANALVGNSSRETVIEMHFPASSLLFLQDCMLAITGADFSATLNGYPVPLMQPVIAAAGSRLQFSKLNTGARAYIAFREQLDIPLWLGSGSTHMKAQCGGWQGRALQKGDVIPFRHIFRYEDMRSGNQPFIKLPWSAAPPANDDTIAVLPGPEYDWMEESAKKALAEQEFTISTVADRMGLQLTEPIPFSTERQLLSSGTGFGTIQLLPGGRLIILMADHQVSGGYPRVGQVAGAALPALAQKQPGSRIKFRCCTIAEAEELLLNQEQYIAVLQTACRYQLEPVINRT